MLTGVDARSFENLRIFFYDQIRRRVLRDPVTFDGPHAQLVDASDAVIRPDDYLAQASTTEIDAFYEALHDLQAENFIDVHNGVIRIVRKPERSDRTKDAPSDHKGAHRSFREVPFAHEGAPTPCTVHVDSLPMPLKGFVVAHDFGERVCVYNRKIEVRGSVWAITYSALQPRDGIEEKLVAKGVLETLPEYGLLPSLRKEELCVRFPYAVERELLELNDRTWRVPIIIAAGRVFAGKHLVEKYVNIMRADRYIITSESMLNVGISV